MGDDLLCPVSDCNMIVQSVRNLTRHLTKIHSYGNVSYASIEEQDTIIVSGLPTASPLPPPSASSSKLPAVAFPPLLPASSLSAVLSPLSQISPPVLYDDPEDLEYLTPPAQTATPPPPPAQNPPAFLSPSTRRYNTRQVTSWPSYAEMSSAPVPSVLQPGSKVLDGNHTYLETNEFLDSFSLRIHSIYRTLHCMECLIAQPPLWIAKHLKNHHGLIMTAEDKNKLQMFATQHQLLDDPQDFPLPSPHGPPVEGLALHLKGYCCQACGTGFNEKRTFDSHWYKNHKSDLTAPDGRWISATLQAFCPFRTKSFAVNTGLTNLSLTDPFALYLKQQVPKFKQSELVFPPVNVKEVPPLLQITEWHVHLAPHIGNKQDIRRLDSTLKHLPGIKDVSPLGRLRPVINRYMCAVRDLCNSSSIGVRSLLIECPR